VSQSTFINTSQNSAAGKVRRSTRVEKTVPLIVLGQNQSGEPFLERTLSVSLNMHGCRYPSRHDCVVGTWITLQIVGLNIPDQKPTTVRAVVRSVHPAASSRELHQVGVELETPANVWGIVPAPADWWCAEETSIATGTVVAPTHDSVTKEVGAGEASMVEPALSVTKVTSLSPTTAANCPPSDSKGPEAPRPQRIVVTSDGLISALQGKLEREAEKAVRAAVTKQLHDLVGKTLDSIEEARRSSVRDIQELCLKQMESIQRSLEDESARAMAVQWKADMEAYRGQTKEISQRFEKQAGELGRELADVQEFAEKATREITPQITGRLKEAVTQATSDFDYSAGLIVDRRYERLLESVHTVTQEALLKLNARSAELEALVQSVANSALDEFRGEVELHRDAALAETKERAVSALSLLDAESRTSCDKRRQALEEEMVRSAERVTEQFRTGMKAFMHSCLVAAVGAVEEHSKTTLDGLLKDEGKTGPEFSTIST
jgi:hypothetical protein